MQPPASDGYESSVQDNKPTNKLLGTGGIAEVAADVLIPALTKRPSSRPLRDDLELGQLRPSTEAAARFTAERLQIVFRNICYSVSVKQKGKPKSRKDVLQNVNGIVNPGRLTFVMGASGAGKTTLLNVVAGHTLAAAEITGTIKVNGQNCSAERMRRISGFVHQEDVILGTMRVREALTFAAQLRLPMSMTTAEKEQRAMDVAELLGLMHCLDGFVGSSMLRGISGGERRRLSLGMEAVTNPSIMYVDEPTSGLDASTAYKVTRILTNLAHNHDRTIVCTIHQPSSDIFHLADDLILLASGQVLYHGEVDHVVPYFARLGYECPTYTNPADFLFRQVLEGGTFDAEGDARYDFINRDTSDQNHRQGPAALEEEARRIQGLLLEWQHSLEARELDKHLSGGTGQLSNAGISKEVEQSYAPFLTQCLLLGGRAVCNMWRNKLALRARVMQVIFLALLVGLIYLHIGHDLQSVQDRQGSLFFIITQGMFGSLMGTLTVFGAEKTVFQREYMGHMYGLCPYFVSRWLVELPWRIILPLVSSNIMYWMVGYQSRADKYLWFALFLILMDNCGGNLGILIGCIFNDITVAMTVMPMFLLPLMVFSGFFVNSDTIPPYFWWIQWISPMKYGFTGLVLNEFSGLVIDCQPPQCPPGYNGDIVISNLGFGDKGSIQLNALVLFAIAVGSIVLAYGALWVAVRNLRKTKAVKDKPAAAAAGPARAAG